MCLIVTLVMFAVSVQSFIQEQWMAASVQFIIALGFMVLLIRNILAVRYQKRGCTTTGCGITDWFTDLFKKSEK